MSSIYKKGRDGYFYYQTYVYNPATKKKDKKIFHSLSTKDIKIAKEKQIEYDKIYSTENKSKLKSLKNILVKRKLFRWILISTSICSLLLYSLLEKKNHHSNIEITKIKKNIVTNDSWKDQKLLPDDIYDSSAYKILNADIDSSLISKNIELKISKKEEVKKSLNHIDNTLPKYNLVRIEKLSNTFQQGKFYITVDQPIDSRKIKLLCDYIKNKHLEFSNIVICIYTDDVVGNQLAKGIKTKANLEKQKKAWLAMFTFNPVEGEYFDDNPAGYLGGM